MLESLFNKVQAFRSADLFIEHLLLLLVIFVHSSYPHSYSVTERINFEQPQYKQLYLNFQYISGTLGYATDEIVWTC